MSSEARYPSYQQILYGPDGSKLAVLSQATTLVKATIPLPGGATAVYNSTGFAYFRHPDWLGSSRLATQWDHTIYAKEAYAPFGEPYNESPTHDRSFTEQDQDTVASDNGLYDFLYRRYHPTQGRWISPDPAGLAAVDFSNPQTWNRYAYVMNSPMAMLDALGLDGCTYAGWLPDSAIPCFGVQSKPACANNACAPDAPRVYDVSNRDPNCPQGYICVSLPGGPSGPTGGGGGGGTSLSFKNLLNLDKCIEKNASTYIVGGLINLAANTDVPLSSTLGSNSVTGTALLLTGQDGFFSTAWSTAKLGYQAARGAVFGATLNAQIMTNGPNSFTTIAMKRGSPQPVLGNGSNYSVSSLGKVAKVLGAAKGIADVALAGALAVNCALGQIP